MRLFLTLLWMINLFRRTIEVNNCNKLIKSKLNEVDGCRTAPKANIIFILCWITISNWRRGKLTYFQVAWSTLQFPVAASGSAIYSILYQIPFINVTMWFILKLWIRNKPGASGQWPGYLKNGAFGSRIVLPLRLILCIPNGIQFYINGHQCEGTTLLVIFDTILKVQWRPFSKEPLDLTLYNKFSAFQRSPNFTNRWHRL